MDCDESTAASPAIYLVESEAIQARRDKLRRQIDSTSMELVMMKREYNDLSRTGRLITDVLIGVFEQFLLILHEDWTKEPIYGRTRPQGSLNQEGTDAFLRVGHVCHRWREIALHSPQLWCNISVMEYTCLAEIAERVSRAGDMPLNIFVTDTCDPMIYRTLAYDHLPVIVQGPPGIGHTFVPRPIDGRQIRNNRTDALKAISSFFPRIGLLDFTTTAETLQKMFGIVPPTLAAPRLHSLKLPSCDSTTPFDGCAMPALQELELSSRHGIWKSPLLCSTLTRLSLKGPSDGNTLLDMIAALQSTPLLEKLDLYDTLPMEPTDHHASLCIPSRSVSLPRLKQLKLTGPVITPVPTQFLAVLRLPSSAYLDITLSVVRGTHFESQLYLGTMFSDLHRLMGEGIFGEHLAVTAHFSIDRAGTVFQFLAMRQSLVHTIGTSKRISSIRIETPWTLGFLGDTNSTIESMLNAFPLYNLQTLTIMTPICDGDIPDVRNSMLLQSWLIRVTALQELCLGMHGAVSFCDLLSSQSGRDAEGDLLLPDLHTVKFVGVDLGYVHKAKAPNPSLCARYADHLLMRKREGSGLRRLIVEDCYNFDEEDRALFEFLVDEVYWDGHAVTCVQGATLSGMEEIS